MNLLIYSSDGESVCKSSEGTEYSSCIDRYIERQMKCKIPWISDSDNITSFDVCSSVNQTLKYLNISKKITNMRETEVAIETDCYIPCTRNEYSVK